MNRIIADDMKLVEIAGIDMGTEVLMLNGDRVYRTCSHFKLFKENVLFCMSLWTDILNDFYNMENIIFQWLQLFVDTFIMHMRQKKKIWLRKMIRLHRNALFIGRFVIQPWKMLRN